MSPLALTIVAVALAAALAAGEKCSEAAPWPHAKASLLRGESLGRGEALRSLNAELRLTTTGDLVLTRVKDQKALWSSNTSHTQASKLTLTTGGNLKLTDAAGTTVFWVAQSMMPAGAAVLQDDCNLALYEAAPFTNVSWTLGTNKCITAHIVPHSHDDVGWLITPEQYFDGCGAVGAPAGVRGIFETILEALNADSRRTFNEVEMYYFQRWWLEINETKRANVRALVANGQLDFINGGWSMHDEACVHHEAALSNMEAGAQFLKREFGAVGGRLNIGWHIDPFGHASTTPRLMAEMGFDAFIFYRNHFAHRTHMHNTKTLENVWQNSKSLGDRTQMFTSIMYDNYCVGCGPNGDYALTCPSSFNNMYCESEQQWKEQHPVYAHFNAVALKRAQRAAKRAFKAQTATPEWIISVAEEYVTLVQSYSANYRTGHVLMPWGCDVGHQNAVEDYGLMDQVIAYINANYATYGIDMFYSSPQKYVKAVQAMDYTWPVNHYDYFPYADGTASYWTGFFSSRAEYKGFERFLMNERTASDIALSAVPAAAVDLAADLARAQVMREVLGVAQHHDSITGTERHDVRDHYQLLMTNGSNAVNAVFADVFNASAGVAPVACMLSNLSACGATGALAHGEPVSMYIFNPLAQLRDEVLTVPVPVEQLDAYLMPAGTKLVSQVVTTWAITKTPDQTSPAVTAHPYQAYVRVAIPPLTLIEVKLVAKKSSAPSGVAARPLPRDVGFTLENDAYAVDFDGATGNVAKITNRKTGLASAVNQSIAHYCPHGPNGQASGAYIFRPCEADAKPTPYATAFQATLVEGPLCTEVRQLIDAANNMQQAWRLCSGQAFVELTTALGTLELGDNGREVVMQLRTDIASDRTWYTDSEGLEMQKRVKNTRFNFPYETLQPVASNFMPVNTHVKMNATAGGRNIAVMADRSRATASLDDGALEFLMHRRLKYDDGRGVGQALDDITRVLSTSRIVMNTATIDDDMRFNSQLLTHRPIVRYGAPSGAAAAFPYLSHAPKDLLPKNIHLHSRTVLSPGVMLVRLQHLFAVDEGATYNVAERVDLRSVLPTDGAFGITSATEMDINGVRARSELKRAAFKMCVDGEVATTPADPFGTQPSFVDTYTVLMEPMQIRTFEIQFHHSK
jgi:lysosomal alpha-mannosidase